MNKKSIHRSSDKPGAKNYTVIGNELIQNEELTFDETALLVYLLSLPINFKIIQKNVLKKCSGRISKGRFYSAWKGLVNKGYIVELKYYQNNLKRIGWEIYELPQNRVSQIEDTREPIALKSTKEENTQIENNILYTRTSILGQNDLKKKNTTTGTSSSTFYENQFDEAAAFLYDATKLGEQLFEYADKQNLSQLMEILGQQEYKKIEPQLKKYMEAVHRLGW